MSLQNHPEGTLGKSFPADVIIRNGRVYTSDPARPWVEAVAIHDGVIVALGSDCEIARCRGSGTEVIDLDGRMVMPGIIDSHVHFVLGSRELAGVRLDDVRSVEEMRRRIRDYAASHPHEAWIRGAGWAYGFTGAGELLSKEILDEAVPDRPAVMEACDRHSLWVNSRALAAARITRDTQDPREDGVVTGEIVRDSVTGGPTGLLKEAAMVLVRNVMIQPKYGDDLSRLRQSMAQANRYGVTAVVNASGSILEMELFEELRRRGELTVRMKTALGEVAGVKHHLSPGTVAVFKEAKHRFNDDWLRSNLIKFFLDGVVETHTAALLEPYSDDPSKSGGTKYSKSEFNSIVTELDRLGFQVMTHAIGDAAVRMTLDAYGAAEKTNGKRDRRYRVEHIELLNPDDLPRFKRLGVIASMQPIHFPAGPDSETWRRNIGEGRFPQGFVWNDLVSSGATLALGSDWPIFTLDAFAAMQACVTRQTPGGEPEGGWYPAERLNLEQALAGYTRNAAYAAFFEDRIGSLTPGKLADVIVLSQNLFDVPAAEIGNTKVLLTMVGGKVVWRDGI